ncbi:MAG TPA: hypothetical protein VGL44_06450 [Gaiellales bacterium]
MIGWWLGSAIAVACLWAVYFAPVDVQFTWQSRLGVEIFGAFATALLAPGFVLGGWKALLVAAGRSAIRTRWDRAIATVFALWAVVSPVFVVYSMFQHGR